jgi:hypothetical protein
MSKAYLTNDTTDNLPKLIKEPNNIIVEPHALNTLEGTTMEASFIHPLVFGQMPLYTLRVADWCTQA